MAQDLTQKRQNIATNAVIYGTQLVNAINGLLELQAQRGVLSQDFQDSDFSTTDLKHLTSGMLGTLFDFVVPSLNTNFVDVANAGRNKQILRQIIR